MVPWLCVEIRRNLTKLIFSLLSCGTCQRGKWMVRRGEAEAEWGMQTIEAQGITDPVIWSQPAQGCASVSRRVRRSMQYHPPLFSQFRNPSQDVVGPTRLNPMNRVLQELGSWAILGKELCIWPCVLWSIQAFTTASHVRHMALACDKTCPPSSPCIFHTSCLQTAPKALIDQASGQVSFAILPMSKP